MRVDHAVKNVEEALIEGALLTVLVVFLFLNSWRSTVITGLALPVSVLASFIAVWVLGFKLETMSLLGLSLAIGILIDDAIVVRENIVRHVEMGKDHYTAAHEGTDEIGLAVAATTFSILAVFVPIGFMPGVGGQWFKPFALTIACSVFVSLFVSFSLDPMLSAYWPDPHVPEDEKPWITKKLDSFNHWFNRQAQNVPQVIAWALDHRVGDDGAGDRHLLRLVHAVRGEASTGLRRRLRRDRGARVGVHATSGSTRRARRSRPCSRGSSLFYAMPKVIAASGLAWRTVGVGFFPEDDRAEFIIALETPPGSNLAVHAAQGARKRRGSRARIPRCCYTYTTLGGGALGHGGRGQHLRPHGPEEQAQRERRSSSRRALRARDEAGGRRDARRCSRATSAAGSKQLQFQLRGNDLAALNQAAEQVMEVVRNTPGAVDIGLSTKGQKPELEVELNRGVAGTLGVTVGQVAQSLRPAFAGIDAGDWHGSDRRDAQRAGAPRARVARNADDLRQLPLVVHGPERRADDDAARSGGDDHAGRRSGDHRPPRSRPGRDGARPTRRGARRGDVTTDV